MISYPMVGFSILEDRLGRKKEDEHVVIELDLVLDGLTGKVGDNLGAIVDGDLNANESMLHGALLPDGPRSFALQDNLGLGHSDSYTVVLQKGNGNV